MRRGGRLATGSAVTVDRVARSVRESEAGDPRGRRSTMGAARPERCPRRHALDPQAAAERVARSAMPSSPWPPDRPRRFRRRAPRPAQAVLDRCAHGRPRRARVLDDVRQRLGDDEVGARLDVRRQPLRADVDVDRKVEPRHEVSTPARSPPRVSAAGRMPCASSRSSALPARRCRAPRRGGPRRRRSRERPLASLSVTIVCTRRCCAPSCRSRTTRRRASSPAVEHARPRGGELIAAVGVGDRGVEQLGEAARRSSVSSGGGWRRAQLAVMTPQMPAVDDDRARRPSSAPDARATSSAIGPSPPVLSSASAPGAGTRRRDAVAPSGTRIADAHESGLARWATIRLVRPRTGASCDLRRPEQGARPPPRPRRRRPAARPPLRDQGRHPPQRRLLVGQALHLGPRLGVRDGRGHEIRELRDPPLGVRRERLVRVVGDDHRAPYAAGRRRSGSRRPTDPVLPGVLCDRSVRGGVIVDTRTARRSRNTGAETPVPSSGKRTPTRMPPCGGRPRRRRRSQCRRARIGVSRSRSLAEQPATSSATFANSSSAGASLRDERGDAPQRGLLVGEAGELDARLGVRDGGGDELRELLERGLGVGRQGRAGEHRRDHRSPDAARPRSGCPPRRWCPRGVRDRRSCRSPRRSYSSTRAARPVRAIRERTFSPPRGSRVPTGTTSRAGPSRPRASPCRRR